MTIVKKDRLLGQLNTTGLQNKDTPLYQVIAELIKRLRDLELEVNGIDTGTGIGTTIISAAGLMGAPGISGEDGDDGQIGSPGLTGARGLDGISNIAGAAGPLTIGPMGIDGDDGNDGYPIPGQAGPVGPQGIQGVAGPVFSGPMVMDGEDGIDGWTIPGRNGTSAASGINTLKVTATQTINAGVGVFTDITELTFPVVAGVNYAFKFHIVFQAVTVTTGWKAGINCPAGDLEFFSTYQSSASNFAAGQATWLQRHNTVRDDMTLLTSTSQQLADTYCAFEGRYNCTETGTLAARFANELSNTEITIRIGSWGIWF